MVLEIKVKMSDTLLNQVLSQAEQQTLPVSMRVLFFSIQSRQRTSVKLTRPSGKNEYLCQLPVNTNEWSGRVEAHAVLFRNAGNPGLPAGLASHEGARLAWSATQLLLFDAPRRPPGRYLQVEWADFRNYPDIWISHHSDNLFSLDLSGEQPRILLNESVPDLRKILDSTAAIGRHARIRDATNSTIAHQVWTSILASVFAGLVDAARSSGASTSLDPNSLLEQLPDWQQYVIKDWSRYLFPSMNLDDSIADVVNATADPAKTSMMLARIPNIIQSRFRTYRGFNGLVSEVLRK